MCGITCTEYIVKFDLDNNKNIKDLTRLKAGLTAQGVIILKDDNSIFNEALKRFNSPRHIDATETVEKQIDDRKVLDCKEVESEPDEIVFLREAIEILSVEYNLDTQGLFEYIREIIRTKYGETLEIEKVFKIIKGKTNKETRYIRCIIIDKEGQNYIIDVDDKQIRSFDVEEYRNKENPEGIFVESSDVPKDWNEREYEGG